MSAKHPVIECLLIACFLAPALFAQSPVVNEYTTLTNPSSPWDITAGPDGALWFTEQGSNSAGNYSIGRINTSGVVTEFQIPPVIVSGQLSPLEPQGLATGPDGALWFTTPYNGLIGRMTTSGTVTTYPIPSASNAQYIVAGPDGKMWFTEQPFSGNPAIGSITMAGVITEYQLPNASSSPGEITVGSDGALWFTDGALNSLGRITTAGVITEVPLVANAGPLGLTTGPDGALWYTDGTLAEIGRVTTAGVVTTYPIASANQPQQGIVTGPDGALWFTEGAAGNIGRITLSGAISEYAVLNSVGGMADPTFIALGPDNNLWFTDNAASAIGQVIPPFSVSCTFPASAEVGASYSASCTAASGKTPYAYSISAGGLPPGLTLNTGTGVISGSPTTPGTYSFTVQAVDSSSPAQKATFQEASLVVTLRQPLTISCNLGAAQAGIAFSASCTGGGGIPPYTYSISSGALPPGLTLNTQSGAVTGVPTTYGTFTFTIQVTDNGSPVATATQPYTVFAVAPPTLNISCTLSDTAQLGVSYSASCTGSGGILPYTYSISSGALPAGLTLNASTGAIAGTPKIAGAYAFTVLATDSGSPAQTAAKVIPVFTVLSANLGLSCNFSKPGQQGTAYTTTCATSNGTPPYTFTISNGALPAGLTLNAATGAVSGTPTAFGAYVFTVQVADKSTPARSVTQLVNGFIVDPSAVTITNSTLPNGFVALPYSGNPLVSGGTAPYSWSVSAGTLPAGLALNETTGAISGTPTTAGAFSFTLQVTDNSHTPHKSSQAFTGSISGPVAPNFIEYPLPASSGVSSITTGPDGNLWFTTADQTSGNLIESVTTAGVFTAQYSSPNNLATNPGGAGIAYGPDGALWFAETDSDRIGRITIQGEAIDFGVTSAASKPQQIVSALDGALWFTEAATSKIGRITGADMLTEYPTLTKASSPAGITAGPDGNLWFTESSGNNIGQITTGGIVKEFPIPTAASSPLGITPGPDGSLWFTENAASKIGRISLSGQITEFPTPTTASGPVLITAGSDGALWFTELTANQIGRITTDGVITEYAVPTATSAPQAITLGPDGAIWFGETSSDKIARFSFAPLLTLSCSPPTAVQVNGTYSSTCAATGGIQPYAFSISAGALPPGVTIDPVAGAISGSPTLPGSFTYTVQVADASLPVQKVTTQIANSIVSPLPLSLACTAPSAAQVGVAYSGGCSGINGTPPYAYSVVAGALPPGVVLDPVAGALSGTPATPGNYLFTVQVMDSSVPAFTAAQASTVVVKFGTVTKGGMPLFTLNGFPTLNQAIGTDATGLSVQLNQAAGIPVPGTLALSFTPNESDNNLPSTPYMDPALQFVNSSGTALGTTYNFTVPASATSVLLPDIDPGTVAGSITASLTMDSLAETSQTFVVPPTVPIIEPGSVQITNVTSTGFDVEVVANSSTRDIEYATFTFTVAPGAKIVGQTSFTFDVSSLMNGWFAAQGLQYGSSFSLTVPFQLSGAMSAIQSVSVTLQNFVGTSAAVSGTP